MFSTDELLQIVKSAPALTERELVALAKMQGRLGVDAIEVEQYGMALAFFEDAGNFVREIIKLRAARR